MSTAEGEGANEAGENNESPREAQTHLIGPFCPPEVWGKKQKFTPDPLASSHLSSAVVPAALIKPSTRLSTARERLVPAALQTLGGTFKGRERFVC